MNTIAPRRLKLALVIAFTASCVGLLLFLWLSFGGSVPFVPQGYRLSAEFQQAVELGTQADVEIAGVTVGKVVSVGLDRHTGLTRAVLQIDPRYAPRPADTRAILRQKTLLGETYVELSFGNPKGGMLPDGGRLPQGQVDSTVQLDQILNTLDPRTRRAFQTWMRDEGIALTGRGQDLNDALARLFPFATNASRVLTVLRRDRAATSTLLSDGSMVLSAISRNPRALRQLIRNADTVFGDTASSRDQLAAAIRALPGFLVGLRRTVASVRRFGTDAKPLVDELQPAARPLSTALERLAKLAPALAVVMADIGPLDRAAQAGIPALDAFLSSSSSAGPGASKTLFAALTPYLGYLLPVIDYLGAYRRELAAFFANGAASSQASAPSLNSSSTQLHYVRVAAPLSPQELTAMAKPPYSNRSNAYPAPGSGKALSTSSTLDVFTHGGCSSNALPAIPAGASTVQYQSVLSLFYGGTTDASKVPAPACDAQGELSSLLRTELGAGLGPASGFYPQLQPLPS